MRLILLRGLRARKGTHVGYLEARYYSNQLVLSNGTCV
jgi:hypothetical protein